MLCSKVLATFADHLCLLHFLTSFQWTRDSDGFFFSSRLVCMTSDSSYNSTDSSLVTVDYQQSFMACDLVCSKSADQAYTHSAWSYAAYYIIVWNRIIMCTLCILQMSSALYSIALLHSTVHVYPYTCTGWTACNCKLARPRVLHDTASFELVLWWHPGIHEAACFFVTFGCSYAPDTSECVWKNSESVWDLTFSFILPGMASLANAKQDRFNRNGYHDHNVCERIQYKILPFLFFFRAQHRLQMQNRITIAMNITIKSIPPTTPPMMK